MPAAFLVLASFLFTAWSCEPASSHPICGHSPPPPRHPTPCRPPQAGGTAVVIAEGMFIVDLGNQSSGDGMSKLTADDPVVTNALVKDMAAERADAGAADADAPAGPAGDAAVAAVRGFNRFYTNVIGLLRGKYLDTPYSLTEARLLFELAQRDSSEAADLRRMVDIDPGYLSRILARFASDGLDRKSTRLNSSHVEISYAVFCLKKKKKKFTYSSYQKKKKNMTEPHG